MILLGKDLNPCETEIGVRDKLFEGNMRNKSHKMNHLFKKGLEELLREISSMWHAPLGLGSAAK